MISRPTEKLLGGFEARSKQQALRDRPALATNHHLPTRCRVRLSCGAMMEDDDCCCEMRVSGDAAADRRAWNASARLAARSSPCKAARA